MVVTTPLCAVHFGMVSILGILTNLLTLWVISFVFYGIMLSCVISLLYFSLGQWIAWSISWPIRYVIGIAGVISRFPLAAVYTDSLYIVFWLVFSYVFLGVFFCAFFLDDSLKRNIILLVFGFCCVIFKKERYPIMDYRIAVASTEHIPCGNYYNLSKTVKYICTHCKCKDK